MSDPDAPEALLLLTSRCPFCPTVLAALSELVKGGRLARLEVVNIERRPEVAQALGVRTVPWVRIGPFELEGLRSAAELRQWAERAGCTEGMADYFNELLTDGKLDKTIELVRQDAARIGALLYLLKNPDTNLQVRVGLSAVMEALAGGEALKTRIDEIGALTRSPDAHVRGDACHYLSLTHSARAVPYLRALLADSERQVREIAADSLEVLRQAGVAVA